MEKSTFILQLSEDELAKLRASVDAETELGRELRYARPRTLEELVSFGQDRLREDYYSDVRSMAEDVLAQVLDEETDEDSAREALDERIHETVDGSQWIIYTARAMDVLRVSDSDGAYFEDFGDEGAVSRDGIEWSKLAFCAMRSDVSELVWTDFESWKETRDSFEEELQERALELSDVLVRDSGSKYADRFLVRIELPDGTPLHFAMGTDATGPGGFCQTADAPADKCSGSIVGPSVTDSVRTAVLRILDTSREECSARVRELRDIADCADYTEEERADARGELESIRELAEAWDIDVDGSKEGA